jgi:chromosome segregation ATPase
MTQPLKRGLLGYRVASVRQVLADREQMFERAVQETRAAQVRADEVDAELETTRNELENTRKELRSTREARDTAVKERDGLQVELVKGRTEHDAARADLAEHRRQLEQARAEARALETDLERVRAEVREGGERIRRANVDAAAARNEVVAVRGQLAARDKEIRELTATVERLEAALEDRQADAASVPAASAPYGEGEATPTTTPRELSRILSETEGTIHRMVADARRVAEHDVSQLERRRDAIRAQIERLIEWRARMASLAEDVRGLLGEAEARTAEVDDGLRTLLDPMTTTIGSLRTRLGELVQAAEEEEPATDLPEGETVSSQERSPVIHLDADQPAVRDSRW